MAREFGIGIGDYVTFRDRHGTSREGRIVGSEAVEPRDQLRRSAGRWLLVSMGPFETVEVPEASVGGILASRV